ncbi:hypothetical protein GCM10009795_026240 [Nocardioides hankookensis]|uniref:Serine/threonine-protein kinase n=1 Tax=Nocardioides hankookensis TaxID=443157 RepID=A0ABW1LE09_9ACTN
MLHGERLDRPTYTLITSLDGGTSDVVLTDHEIFGIQVVQKTVSLLGVPDGVATSEPRVLEGLEHDHLVRVREAQWDPDHDEALQCITFTTDFYPGRSLLYALEQGHEFSVRDVLEIVDGILSALVYLHEECGLLHRDIKLGNVMLAADMKHARLGDLALAAAMDPSTGTTEPANATPLYIAPEAAAGALDVRSDLYQVGCVMLELLNGLLPYAEIDRDKVDSRLSEGRRPLSNPNYDPAPWVPANVARVLRKLVAQDPDRRYASAREALRAVRHLRCVGWQRIGGAALVGRWSGKYPPNVPAARARVYEVNAELVEKGKYQGQLLLTARWRNANSVDWRNYAGLTRRVPVEDARELASFFRDVEAKAHSAPTR